MECRRSFYLSAFLLTVGFLKAQTSSGTVWDEFRSRREKLTSFHQEFECTRALHLPHGEQRQTNEHLTIDGAGPKWRQNSATGLGHHIIIFDGDQKFVYEEAGDGYIRVKIHSNDDPQPEPYAIGAADWTKATEIERNACGIPGVDHTCVGLRVHLKPFLEPRSALRMSKVLGGTALLRMDTQTGLLLTLHAVLTIEDSRGDTFQEEMQFSLKRIGFGMPADASIYQLPAFVTREVKEFTHWDAAKIRKQLAGQPSA